VSSVVLILFSFFHRKFETTNLSLVAITGFPIIMFPFIGSKGPVIKGCPSNQAGNKKNLIIILRQDDRNRSRIASE
jgi:hypothetical protein